MTIKNVYVLNLIVLGLLLCSGCSTFELPDEPGVLLFQDDFSSPNSGWDRVRADTYSADYDAGAYKIEVFQVNHEAWSLPGLNFSDVYLEVTIRKTTGPDDNVFGLVCRYQDPDNFYFFLISSDGFAGIGYHHDGMRTLLSGDSMLPAEEINLGTATNKIRVGCIENKLTIEVNDSALYSVQSDLLQEGDVGLIAGSYDHGGISVLFDNFSVRNP